MPRPPRLPFSIDDALWRFDTARLSVTFHATEEDLAPEDSFQFPEDVAFARSGDPAAWFCAWVVVWDEDGRPVAWDTLGGCSYNSFREFYASHRTHKSGDYFTDMVRQAVAAARVELETRRAVVA